MIDDVADILIRNRVRATWFVTHASAAVDRLRAVPELFELGLHPNFFPGQLMASRRPKCCGIASRSCRTPGPSARMGSSSRRRSSMRRWMPGSRSTCRSSAECGHVTGPFEYWRNRRRLWRLPYIWEDDMEMEQPVPSWSTAAFGRRGGVQVVDFHPTHIWLNAPDLRAYEALKARAPELTAATRTDAEPLRRNGTDRAALFRSRGGRRGHRQVLTRPRRCSRSTRK